MSPPGTFFWLGSGGLINIININVEGSSNVQYEKLPVEETLLKEIYIMIHCLHIPIIPNIMSAILYEIYQLSEQFPKILNYL